MIPQFELSSLILIIKSSSYIILLHEIVMSQ